MRIAGRTSLGVIIVMGALGLTAAAQAPTNARAVELKLWAIHDVMRPMPPVVDPGPAGPPAPVPARSAWRPRPG